MSEHTSSRSGHSHTVAAAACSAEQLAAEHRRARQFTEVAFALAALAALAFAAIIHHTSFATILTEEARRVVTWSFVGLAALDTALLLIWQRLMSRIAGSDRHSCDD